MQLWQVELGTIPLGQCRRKLYSCITFEDFGYTINKLDSLSATLLSTSVNRPSNKRNLVFRSTSGFLPKKTLFYHYSDQFLFFSLTCIITQPKVFSI